MSTPTGKQYSENKQITRNFVFRYRDQSTKLAIFSPFFLRARFRRTFAQNIPISMQKITFTPYQIFYIFLCGLAIPDCTGLYGAFPAGRATHARVEHKPSAIWGRGFGLCL